MALGIFTKLLDPYLKLIDPYLKDGRHCAQDSDDGRKHGNAIAHGESERADVAPEVDVDGAAGTPPANTPATKPAPVVNLRFDNSKVRIINAPEKDFAVFSRWTWKPELAGVEELDQSLPGWKMVPFIKNQPPGMTVEGDTIVWTAKSKDFEALKAGEKFTVDLTIKRTVGWAGRRATRSVRHDEIVHGLQPVRLRHRAGDGHRHGGGRAQHRPAGNRRADGDGMRDMIDVTQRQPQSRLRESRLLRSRRLQAEPHAGRRRPLLLGLRLPAQRQRKTRGSWRRTGRRVKSNCFVLKAGRLEAGSVVKLAPGIVSLAAMEVGKDKTAIGALSSTAGVLSMVVYEQEKGLSPPMSVACYGRRRSCGMWWRGTPPILGPGFLAVRRRWRKSRCASRRTRKGERDKAGMAIRSALKEDGVITAAARVAVLSLGLRCAAPCAGAGRKSIAPGSCWKKKPGRFGLVGHKDHIARSGFGDGGLRLRHKDGVDDLFVVTRDEVCFYFLNDTGNAVAGPRFPNPGMLGPVVLLGFGNNTRPDIAVLNENKKARVFKPVGQDRGGNVGQNVKPIVAPRADSTHLVGLAK